MGFITLDYPREVLDVDSEGQGGFRRLVRDEQELMKYWKGKNGIGNVYFTAYGYRATTPPKHHRVDYNTPIIRHFVMDFDCKDFSKRGVAVDFSFVQNQVARLHDHLLVNDYEHYIWFSGGGYHVYVLLEEVFMPSIGLDVSRIKEAGRTLLLKWHRELNLPSNDPTVAFDTAGMIRIPNSYNTKRGCWTIPLETNEVKNIIDHDELIELAQKQRTGYTQHGNKRIKLELKKKKAIFKTAKRNVSLPDISLDKILILPCIAQAALGPGNPIHRARFHLANYLAARLRYFFPPASVKNEDKEKHLQQIVEICEQQGWVDFDRSITTTQVRSIVFGDYNFASCKTLMTEGMCIGICPYYDGTGEDLV